MVKRPANSCVSSGGKALESLPPDAPGAMIRRSQRAHASQLFPVHLSAVLQRGQYLLALSEVLLLPSPFLNSWYFFVGFLSSHILLDFSVTLLGVSLSQILFSSHSVSGSLMWRE